VRNDGNADATNYNALKADLDALKTANPNFTYGEVTYAAGGAAFVTSAKTSKVIIWFRGTSDTPWTAQQVNDCAAIMGGASARPIVYMCQNLSINGTPNTFYTSFGWAPTVNPAVTAPGFTDQTFINTLTGTNAHQDNQGSGTVGKCPISYQPAFSFQAANIMTGATTQGERYTGTGSSGKLPTASDFASTFQNQKVTVIHPPQFQTPAAPATQTVGIGIPNLWFAGAPVSWGNTATSTKCWVVGYPWSRLAFTAGTPSTPTRPDALRNILASLDSTVGSAPTGPPPFNSYNGPAQILQVTAMQFKSDGTFVLGNNVTPGTGVGQFPDSQFGANSFGATLEGNVYRGTAGAAGTNYVLYQTGTRTYPVAEDDAYNGNDVQFQAPLYAYITDPNSSVTVNGSGVLSGDEAFKFGGLLITNNGTWTRVNPQAAGYKQWATLLATNAVGTPFLTRNPVAGYYVSTTANFGGVTLAGYGLSPADFVFNNADGRVSVEAIAHWDPGTVTYGASPANVVWKLFPAHAVSDVSTGAITGAYGQGSVMADQFWRHVDIDPAVTPTFSRTNKTFNASPYVAGQRALGRVIEYAFSTTRGWDSDLDRDGVRVGATEDVDDKFPAECRIFSNFNVYNEYFNNNWSFPNNVPRATSFVEGGCYLHDVGPKVLGLTVADDGVASNNPNTQVVPNYSVTPYTWTVTLIFKISGSLPVGYKIELNTNYPGGTFTDITSLVTPDTLNDGVKQAVVTISSATQPAGSYTFAIRATDNGPSPTTSTFFWPVQVALDPPFLFQDNFNSLTLAASKWQTPTTGNSGGVATTPQGVFIASSTSYPTYANPGAPAAAGSPQEGAGFMRFTSAPASGIFQGPFWNTIKTQNLTSVPGKVYNYSYWSAGACYGYSGSFLSFWASYDGGSTWFGLPATTGTDGMGNWGYYAAPAGTMGLNPSSSAPQNGSSNSPYEFYESWSASGQGFCSPTTSPAGGWYERKGTITPPGTQVMFAWNWNGYFNYGAGLAIDNILIQ
jgi:hypothetical protein